MPVRASETALTVVPPVARKITVIQDTALKFPDLYLAVYIEGPPEDCAGFAEMFVRTGSYRVNDPDRADVVVFVGGEDVNPALYNQKPHSSVYYNDTRDNEEIALYLHCVENGIPMFGVCRGAQFLHVMNGGSLFQDVDGHNGEHGIFCHKDKVFIQRVSSVHHQMCIDNTKGGMEVLATSSKSTERSLSPTQSESGKIRDIEAFFYRETCSLGVQGHPEYRGYPLFTQWCLNTIDSLVVCNPDLIYVGAVRRINPDILAQHKMKWTPAAEISLSQELN